MFIDTDECSEKMAGCSQICTNTPGGFNCSCNSGYHLGWDRRFCTGKKTLFTFVQFKHLFIKDIIANAEN
jgi:hypothetical protein